MRRKRFLYILAAVIAVLGLSLEARTIYVTRHGQREKGPIKAIREPALTKLGIQQAQALADYLVHKRKFKGVVYTSPFYRTVETAIYTGKLLKKKVILEPGIQELATISHPAPPGMSFAQIESYFPGLTVRGKRFKDQWRLCKESHLQRSVRVAKALEEILAEEKGDILLVGHGASVGDLLQALNLKRIKGVRKIKGTAWNCALYIFELNDREQVVSGRYTTEFMNDKDVTNNFRCPKIERPNDPQYMTRAGDRADRAKRAAKNKKQAGKAKNNVKSPKSPSPIK